MTTLSNISKRSVVISISAFSKEINLRKYGDTSIVFASSLRSEYKNNNSVAHIVEHNRTTLFRYHK